MTSFFRSPFWLDVRYTLERAPQFLRGGGTQWVADANVARRLLENRLECVRIACDGADYQATSQLRRMLTGLEIETVLYGLLDALKEVVLIVGASMGVGAAAGAGFGAFFGGVGAVPGAAIGAALGTQAGMWILSALGLASLAEFFLEGLPTILQHYYQGFSQAWHAGRDEITEGGWHGGGDQSFRLGVASDRIAEGHVAMVLLLLGAIVNYLTRGRGSMQALASQASGGRLGPAFAQWMVKHEDKLRSHPRLQPSQRRPTGAVGDEAGGAPPPPKPPRRDDREPGGPSRMPRKDVRCFKTNDLPGSKVPEFDRQLAGQEAGLNRMTVEDYLQGREAFDAQLVTRDPQVARVARAKYEQDLVVDITNRLRTEGLSRNEAKAKAVEIAADKMSTLAALHNPDMQAAGEDVIADFGDRNVNSRIGASWNAGKRSRLDELDDAARAIPEGDRARTSMNAKLERCK